MGCTSPVGSTATSEPNRFPLISRVLLHPQLLGVAAGQLVWGHIGQVPVVTPAQRRSGSAGDMFRPFQNRQVSESLPDQFHGIDALPSAASAGLVLSAPQSEGRNADRLSAVAPAQDSMAAIPDLG